MKIAICVFGIIAAALMAGCNGEVKQLTTRSVVMGENRCTVQQMPAEFQEGNGGDRAYDYFRIIIDSKAQLSDSSHVNYVNFGIENSIRKVSNADTIYPAFVHRIANGKKNNYEYLVSFKKQQKGDHFEIIVDDEAFEMGTISIKF